MKSKLLQYEEAEQEQHQGAGGEEEQAGVHARLDLEVTEDLVRAWLDDQVFVWARVPVLEPGGTPKIYCVLQNALPYYRRRG